MSRIEKVNELIKEEVSKCIPEVVGDDLGMITVLKADVTKDLKKADVWVSILGKDEDDKYQVLIDNTNLIRKELAGKIKLKYTPKIEFHHDKTGQYASHIEKILNKIKKDKER